MSRHRAVRQWAALILTIAVLYGGLYAYLSWDEGRRRAECEARSGHYLTTQDLCVGRDRRVILP